MRFYLDLSFFLWVFFLVGAANFMVQFTVFVISLEIWIARAASEFVAMCYDALIFNIESFMIQITDQNISICSVGVSSSFLPSLICHITCVSFACCQREGKYPCLRFKANLLYGVCK
jgi:hypothetical protein